MTELFAATRWSLISHAARGRDDTAARSALAELCRGYWPAVHAYLLKRGFAKVDAEDLAQEFFSRLLARDWLAEADRGKGKFRAFLLTALKRFLANERDRAHAQKRGGGAFHLPLETAAEQASSEASPDHAFDRRWALTVLEQALARVAGEYAASGKAQLFEELKEFLGGSESSYREAAQRSGLSEGAVKVSVHRLRRRYREALRAEIAPTVSTAEEIESEIRELIAAVT